MKMKVVNVYMCLSHMAAYQCLFFLSHKDEKKLVKDAIWNDTFEKKVFLEMDHETFLYSRLLRLRHSLSVNCSSF